MANAVEKKDKPGFVKRVGNSFKRVGRFFKNMWSEMKKVSWPTSSKLFNNTLIVIAVIVIFAVIIFVLDKFFAWGLEALIQLLGGTV
jgi:preprotein translocase subunit SecE